MWFLWSFNWPPDVTLRQPMRELYMIMEAAQTRGGGGD